MVTIQVHSVQYEYLGKSAEASALEKKMRLEEVASTAVLVANQFNPSIITPGWLIRNQIIGDDDFDVGCVFTEVLVQINSRTFQLFVSPQQCQVTPRREAEGRGEIVRNALGAIARTLPHTPYSAAGLNFIWNVSGTEDQVRALSHRMFFVPNGCLHQHFDDDNARFGGYLSKNSLGCRLKLDVRPVVTIAGPNQTHSLQFNFNFHADLPNEGDTVESIAAVLRNWEIAFEQSRQTIQQSIGDELE